MDLSTFTTYSDFPKLAKSTKLILSLTFALCVLTVTQ